MAEGDTVQSEWLWLVVCGSFAAFLFGWGTGANDVANAFGTSVGAKTLKLWQASILAAIFEFTGALVLGRVSTSTIAGSIANLSTFYSQPAVYAYGMLVALFVGGVWQGVASHLEMNVSATHSIIGGIVGFAIAYDGFGAVNWATPSDDVFPPFKGVVPIILSWFISPLLTGTASAIIFYCLRFLVLRRKNSYFLSLCVFPPLVTITIFVNLYFVFTKGAKKALSSNSDWSDAKAAWIAAAAAGASGLLTAFILVPLLRWRILYQEKQQAAAALAAQDGNTVSMEMGKCHDLPAGDCDDHAGADEHEADITSTGRLKNVLITAAKKSKKWALHGLTVDIHKVVEDDPMVASLHAHAELFDPKAEQAFSYLQVFSAICVILSHGAGEVGYMSGPLGTIWDVYTTGTLHSKITPPVWIIVVGASGLVTGLVTYGYNVTRAMGTRMAKLSPTRGFCAEISTSFVIMIAAQYGLPTSSSQCITGGIVGVGLLEGMGGVNWKFLCLQMFGWVSTVVLVAFTVGIIFAQAVYAPGKFEGAQVNTYRNTLSNFSATNYKNFNKSLQLYKNASQQGLIPSLPYSLWQTYNSSVAYYYKWTTNAVNPKYNQSVPPEDIFNYYDKSLAMLQQNSLFTLGQVNVTAGAPICNGHNTTAILAGDTTTCKATQLLPLAFNTSFP